MEFAQYIVSEGKKLEDKITMIEGTSQLNKAWNTWLRIVKTVANKFIPFSYVAPKQFFAQTMKTTKLYRALTSLNKVIHKIKIMVLPINPEYKLAEINKKILKLTKQANIGLPPLTVEDLTINKNTIIGKLKKAKTLLWAAQNAENQAVQNERIRDDSLWPEWQKYYEPKTDISSNIYANIDKDISIKELKEIINHSPLGKQLGLR
ncbi:46492_t:CDS:2, partial [Gigaspora margarita]